MSLNALLFPNGMKLNAGIIELQGLASGSVKTAPLIINSNVVCANLHSEIWNGKYINETVAVGDLLVCSNSITQTFTRLPIGSNGQVLTANSAATLGLNWA